MNIGKNNVLEETDGVNFRNPKIPEGYIHLEGTWDTGLVIQNLTDKSEFVWIPIGWLEKNGTHDGVNFNERFGRRNFSNSNFSETGYHEEADSLLIESINKYGGFYFSRFHASKENKKLVFRKGNMPWVDINYYDAGDVVADYAKDNKDVISCLISGAAFDSVLCWIIQSEAKSLKEVCENSASWGNYWNSPETLKGIMPTGSNEKWCACNIYDIAGNVDEWTSEEYGSICVVSRGGAYYGSGYRWPAAYRFTEIPKECSGSISFRAVLYLK